MVNPFTDWEFVDYMDKGEVYDVKEFDAENKPYVRVYYKFKDESKIHVSYIRYDGCTYDEKFDDKLLFYVNNADELIKLTEKDNGEDFYLTTIGEITDTPV